MSPSRWCALSSPKYALSKIGHSKLIPDILRCRLVAHDVHMSWDRPGASAPQWTLAQAEAYEAMVQEKIQWVLDTYYGGQLSEEHDFHEDEDANGGEDGEGEGKDGEGSDED